MVGGLWQEQEKPNAETLEGLDGGAEKVTQSSSLEIDYAMDVKASFTRAVISSPMQSGASLTSWPRSSPMRSAHGPRLNLSFLPLRSSSMSSMDLLAMCACWCV